MNAKTEIFTCKKKRINCVGFFLYRDFIEEIINKALFKLVTIISCKKRKMNDILNYKLLLL